jgi:hypothetical protein
MLLSYWNEHLMIELEPDLNSQNIVLHKANFHFEGIHSLKINEQLTVFILVFVFFFFAKANNSQIVQ